MTSSTPSYGTIAAKPPVPSQPHSLLDFEAATPVTYYGSGDTSLVPDLLAPELSSVAFERVKDEVEWNTMYHRGRPSLFIAHTLMLIFFDRWRSASPRRGPRRHITRWKVTFSSPLTFASG